MDFRKQRPIYLQIADNLCGRILNDEWNEEERMASVRDIATELEVNPNTVLRTFEYLQNNEIIYNRRGVGYFVSAKAKQRIMKMQRNIFLHEEWPAVLQRIKMLGITLEELSKDL